MRITTVLAITVVGYAWGGFVTTQNSSVTVKEGVTPDGAKAIAAALKATGRATIEGQSLSYGDLQHVLDVSIEQTTTTTDRTELPNGDKTVTTTYREELTGFDDESSQDTVDRVNFPEAYQDEAEEEDADA